MKQQLVHSGTVGDNLRILRKRSGLLQREVAAQLQVKEMEITREIYAQIEAGIHNIDVDVLRALKQIYRASWEEILDGPPEDEPAFGKK